MQRLVHKAAAVLILSMLSTAALGQAAGAGAAPPPTKLAVVNVVKLFADLDEKKDADVDIQNMQKDFNAEINRQKAIIEKLTADLTGPNPTYNPNSAEARKSEDDLLQKTADLDSYTRVSQQKLFLEMRLRTAMLYEKMNKAVGDYAQANGIALVFAADEMNVKDARSAEQLQMMITVKKLVYFNAMFDITPALKIKMNGEYKPRAGR